MKKNSICILAALTAICAQAQTTATVSGAPTLGYAFDRAAHSLRPISGIPGAATMGQPLDLGFAVRDAVVSSEQGYALAWDGSGAKLIQMAGSSVSDVPVVGTETAMFLSPHGTAAAIMTNGWIGILTGMRQGSPQVAGLPFNSQPVTAAVSDDGAYVLAAQPDGTAVLFGRDGTQTTLAVPGPVSRVAFRPGSTDALAASPDNRVWLIQNSASSAVFTPLASGADGVSSAVGLGFLPDGNRAVIANSGNNSVLTVDVVTGVRSAVSCSCTPVQLESMATPGIFRLTEATGEPQYLFNGTSGQIFFVPAVRQERAIERRAGN